VTRGLPWEKRSISGDEERPRLVSITSPPSRPDLGVVLVSGPAGSVLVESVSPAYTLRDMVSARITHHRALVLSAATTRRPLWDVEDPLTSNSIPHAPTGGSKGGGLRAGDAVLSVNSVVVQPGSSPGTVQRTLQLRASRIGVWVEVARPIGRILHPPSLVSMTPTPQIHVRGGVSSPSPRATSAPPSRPQASRTCASDEDGYLKRNESGGEWRGSGAEEEWRG
jgi:hypothetical protein